MKTKLPSTYELPSGLTRRKQVTHWRQEPLPSLPVIDIGDTGDKYPMTEPFPDHDRTELTEMYYLG